MNSLIEPQLSPRCGTDFTYFKITGWGWCYFGTILDDYSRYIVAWKFCTNMRAEDVTDTIELAVAASGCETGGRSAQTASAERYWGLLHLWRSGRMKNRTLASSREEPHPAGKLLPAR